jgi:hypothetical protein
VRRRLALLLALAVVIPGAAGALLASASVARERTGQDEAFQRLVGGLGLGPAVDLSRCAGGFDPRVETSCTFRHEPVPCGSIFCPSHAGAGPHR